MKPLLLCALLATAVQPPEKSMPRYAIESKLARKIEAHMTWTETAPNLKAEEWIVYAPSPPHLFGRQINVHATMNLPHETVAEFGPLHQQVLRSRVPPVAKGGPKAVARNRIHVEVTYKADLYARHLVELGPDAHAPAIPKLTAANRAHYLAANDLLNFKEARFQKWLTQHKLHKGKAEHDIDFGKRAYRVVTTQFTYYWKDPMDWHVTAICQSDLPAWPASLSRPCVPTACLPGWWWAVGPSPRTRKAPIPTSITSRRSSMPPASAGCRSICRRA
jgi:hypothetical protein